MKLSKAENPISGADGPKISSKSFAERSKFMSVDCLGKVSLPSIDELRIPTLSSCCGWGVKSKVSAQIEDIPSAYDVEATAAYMKLKQLPTHGSAGQTTYHSWGGIRTMFWGLTQYIPQEWERSHTLAFYTNGIIIMDALSLVHIAGMDSRRCRHAWAAATDG